MIRLIGVPVPGHAHHAPAELAEVARGLGIPRVATAPDVATALRAVAHDARSCVLVLGSLYLAGVVLAENGESPE